MNNISASQAARLRDQFEPVLAAFISQPLQQLQRRAQPGKWSAMEQLAHIGRYTDYFLGQRLPLILTTDNPSFGRYKAEEDEGFGEWLQLDKQALLQRFRAIRQALADHLLSLSPAQLGRQGLHPLFGALTIPQWTEFFLLHEAHHLYALFGLLHQPHQ